MRHDDLGGPRRNEGEREGAREVRARVPRGRAWQESGQLRPKREHAHGPALRIREREVRAHRSLDPSAPRQEDVAEVDHAGADLELVPALPRDVVARADREQRARAGQLRVLAEEPAIQRVPSVRARDRGSERAGRIGPQLERPDRRVARAVDPEVDLEAAERAAARTTDASTEQHSILRLGFRRPLAPRRRVDAHAGAGRRGHRGVDAAARRLLDGGRHDELGSLGSVRGEHARLYPQDGRARPTPHEPRDQREADAHDAQAVARPHARDALTRGGNRQLARPGRVRRASTT